MKPGIIITLTLAFFSNLPVAAQELSDTSQVSIRVIHASDNDPFDKQIVLTDKASQKVINTIHTKELDPWPMNQAAPVSSEEWGADWYLVKETVLELPKERLYDYQNNNYFQGTDNEHKYYANRLSKIIRIVISPKGQYFIVEYVYEVLDGEGFDVAGRTQIYLFDVTGKQVSTYTDNLSCTSDKLYFTADEAYLTFAIFDTGPNYVMERPYKGTKILSIPHLQIVKTILYDKNSDWWQSSPVTRGNYILIGRANYTAQMGGYDVIDPHTMTLSRREYDRTKYSPMGTTQIGIRMKTPDGATRVDSFVNFEYVGF